MNFFIEVDHFTSNCYIPLAFYIIYKWSNTFIGED